MKAIVKNVRKKNGEIFESVVNEVINVVYSNELIILVTSDGKSVTYSNSNEDYSTVISVV